MNLAAPPTVDTSSCDREPIHIPGAIQPHGLLLVANPATLLVQQVAGDVEGRLGVEHWRNAPLADILGRGVTETAQGVVGTGTRGIARRVSPPFAEAEFDVTMMMAGDRILVELEPAPPPDLYPDLLAQIEAAAAAFEECPSLQKLCQRAASEFRRLTGYSRVMVYRFLEDDAGVVVAEDLAADQHSFLNHHFPASDIPKQARTLYVRNLVRVIPDVHYTPAPLRPDFEGAPLDMSDSLLRSVSPVHLQYLRNMGVGASASISLVKDGLLWGLIAAHHHEPLAISQDQRAACRALAGGLSRQIKAREETDAYRERVRLRTFEDDIVSLLSREGSLDQAVSNHLDEIMRMLSADGVAVLRGGDLVMGGRCPAEPAVRQLASWAVGRSSEAVFATERLADSYALNAEDRAIASGLLAVIISAADPWIVMWFRAEVVEVVNWAGNPHKNALPGPDGHLTPRKSFELWTETVRGRARRWTLPEIEAAGRLRLSVMNVWQTRRMRDLNRQLLKTLDEKDLLLQQKEFLIGEVNHRVQNSLQLVSSFLGLQARESQDPALHAAVEEARRRLSAVSLVHRRLYRADQLEAVDAARYVDELLNDLFSSMGEEWSRLLTRDLAPIILPTDRAVGLGLVLTELVINANKYAYGGGPGPLRVSLVEDRSEFRLIVADSGVGRTSTGGKGFGSRMMEALIGQLGGGLEFQDNKPGCRATLVAPITLPGK